MVIGKGQENQLLDQDDARAIVCTALETLHLENRRVLVIIPDGTRSAPIPQMVEMFDHFLGSTAKVLDYLVALGTHQPMTDAQLTKLVGRPVENGRMGNSHVYNHEWSDPANFALIGTLSALEIEKCTQGLMSQQVDVRLNKLIFEYDQVIICGPVFPHEVVGFSGGNKYLFPGIAGPEIINFTHWLGAVITNYQVIGSGYTPVRAVIDKAAQFVDRPVACFSLVVSHEGLIGLYFGSAQESWKAAADLSARVHITYVDRPYLRVLSIMPKMYDDLWTAAKGMYKLEPVIADGGEVIIFAPHISEISYTHGKLLDEIGYHCRDYFLKQWDRFKNYPGGVLAHSTHLKGLGQYDAATQIEEPRIHVTLATGISEERCRKVNLGYQDPSRIQVSEWLHRESEGLFVVPRAGEMLFRIKQGNG